MSRTSTSSTRTRPAVASNSRGISEISVDLPAPVEPMMAVVSPGWAVNVMLQSTGVGTRIGETGVLGERPTRSAGR